MFLPEEVWHEKLPNPFDFWRGMSPLAVAATAAGTDHAASLFMKGIMEKMGTRAQSFARRSSSTRSNASSCLLRCGSGSGAWGLRTGLCCCGAALRW